MRKIEFSVDIIEAQDDCLMVSGRCCQNDICIGDEFTSVYNYRPPKSIEDYDPPEDYNQRSILVTVKRIEAYQRDWDRLDSGWTARLKLKGTGFEKIKEGDFLGSAP